MVQEKPPSPVTEMTARDGSAALAPSAVAKP